jgi:hypothetical protein
VYGNETRAKALQLKYDDVGDDDDDDNNNNNNNNLLHFTSYLRNIFCVGMPLYKSSLVFSPYYVF